MERSEQLDICAKALDTLGEESQLNVAVEELSELIKEICKYNRDPHRDKILIQNEIADVEIMLEQLKLLFGPCDQYKESKLLRLKARLEQKHYICTGISAEQECGWCTAGHCAYRESRDVEK